jgi:ABC-2 type transport system ATP-binding protein
VTGTAPAVQIERLTRTFRGRRREHAVTALDGVDLRVERGECFGLLGPNGAGKTTLIKILTTLLFPTSGSARVAGFDVATEPLQVRRRINMVSGGDSSGYGILTVRETLHLFARLYGVPGPEARRRADALLEITRLSEKADTRLSSLSTGMKQKLNFARGFMSDPEILFLDEPTSGLDPIGAAAFDQLIRGLQKSLGLTVFMVTHDLDSLATICDRIAVLVDKRIKVGTMEEFLQDDHPWIREYFHGPRGRAARHEPA